MNIWAIAKLPARAAFNAVSRINLLCPHRYIFVLGHMRSGSTLLAHILASHPDIVGAGETHTSYQTPADLSKLVLKTSRFLHKPILRETYIVDQINHDYITDEVLLLKYVHKCIILIREPEATLKSMMNLSIWPEPDTLALYVGRLEKLAHYSAVLKNRAICIQYEDLVDKTHATLTTLTRFLGLKSPLTSDYSTHRMTGRVEGFGDPSDNIKIGRIVRTPEHKINLSKETLVTATRAFHACQERLGANCCQ